MRFELTYCPLGGLANACRTAACTTPEACPLTGLQSGTTYTVSTVAFKADDSPSLISNTDTFTTPAGCPAGQVACGSKCITSPQCCTRDNIVGAKCGSLCIDKTSQCCRTNSTAGLQCASPAVCNSDGGACGERGPIVLVRVLAKTRVQPLKLRGPLLASSLSRSL